MKNKITFNKFFWGIIFVLAGTLLLINQLGHEPLIKGLSLSGILLTILLLWICLYGIRYVNFYMILLGLACICIQYDEALGITALTPYPILGAAILISTGLTMISPYGFYRKSTKRPSPKIENFQKVYENNNGDCISFHNSFGTASKQINSNAFTQAKLSNNFGQLSISFDNAMITSDCATVNLSNSFGEIILYIPNTWQVENNIKVSAGNVRIENAPIEPKGPVLKLYGSVSFGDIRVVYL